MGIKRKRSGASKSSSGARGRMGKTIQGRPAYEYCGKRTELYQHVPLEPDEEAFLYDTNPYPNYPYDSDNEEDDDDDPQSPATMRDGSQTPPDLTEQQVARAAEKKERIAALRKRQEEAAVPETLTKPVLDILTKFAKNRMFYQFRWRATFKENIIRDCLGESLSAVFSIRLDDDAN